jgi:hypothetical protein
MSPGFAFAAATRLLQRLVRAPPPDHDRCAREHDVAISSKVLERIVGKLRLDRGVDANGPLPAATSV